MKAVVHTHYGNPCDSLSIKEIPIPTPNPEEVLIRVITSAVNDYDWSLVRGKPYLYRLMFGLFRPKKSVPGMEVAGIITHKGSAVKKFKVGDMVYGDLSEFGFGSMAEYLAINEQALTLKPQKMGFNEAVTIPHAAMLAQQGLKESSTLNPPFPEKPEVLINGAGGGVGTFAIQLAKKYWSQAIVTGVDRKEKLKMMLDLGYDRVIDYMKEDFTCKNHLRKYDLILDTKTNRSPFTYLKVLHPQGRYVTIGGHLPQLLQLLFFRPVISLFSGKTMKIISLKTNHDLMPIHQLYEKGKLQFVIDGPYTLEEVPQAITRFGAGKHLGKIVIAVKNELSYNYSS